MWSSLSRTMASVDTGMTSLKSLGWWGSGTPTPDAETGETASDHRQGAGDLVEQLPSQKTDPAIAGDQPLAAHRMRERAQQAACAGSAPRDSSPASNPASTSPLPEVPSPASPLSSRQPRPSGAATCPYSDTTASYRAANSAASASRSSPGLPPEQVPGLGDVGGEHHGSTRADQQVRCVAERTEGVRVEHQRRRPDAPPPGPGSAGGWSRRSPSGRGRSPPRRPARPGRRAGRPGRRPQRRRRSPADRPPAPRAPGCSARPRWTRRRRAGAPRHRRATRPPRRAAPHPA